MDKYILDAQGNAVRCPDLMQWAEWFDNTDNRRVAWDDLPNGDALSTVFLGIDHNFTREGPPILWETGWRVHGDYWRILDRYTSRQAALDGHKAFLERIQKGEPIEEV